MNWQLIFVLAAVAAVYGFGRDILRAMLDKRKAVIKSAQDQIVAPLHLGGIALGDAEKAVALQSSLLVQSRADFQSEMKRRIEAESERDQLKERLAAAELRERDLLVRLGQLSVTPRPERQDGVQ